ncbi:MAG: hypothetical protein JW966_14050 [Anaerolineae bacterium]|nr:hypothetical protein [Anaerolineae bacterium]
MSQATITRKRAQSFDPANAVLPGLRGLSLVIMCLAGTGLAFQVALTRAFSLMFQYHYVFLVVSLATLGLGMGAAGGYALSKRLAQRTASQAIAYSLALLALMFPFTAWALTQITSSDVNVGTIVIALVPFALTGWINALIYTRYAEYSGTIYGADLTGAAAGLVVGPVLITYLGPFGTTAALGVAAAFAALLLAAGSWQRPASAVLVVMLLVFAGINGRQEWLAYDLHDLKNAPPDKTMVHMLNDPAQDATVIQTAWSPFAQVDVVETNDDSAKFVFTDAGAGSIMLRYDPDSEAQDFDWMQNEVAYLPFETTPIANTLVIGSGAGYDIVMARAAGAESITAVEINPAIVDITRDYAGYNGDVLDLPGVKTVVTDGRNFVDRSDEQFDLIYLNFVYSQAARPGVSALSENYAFTTEALRAYWDRLADNGRMAFVMHTSVHGLRLMLTAVQMLNDEGLSTPDALHHMLLVNRPNPTDPTVTPSVLIVSRAEWAEDDVNALLKVPSMCGMEPQYLPYLWEDYLAPLAEGTLSLAGYIDAYKDHDISITTDNQPFFYHLDHRLPDPLDTLAIISGLLMTGYFIVGAALQAKKPTHEWARVDLLAYFTLLGIGFMLAEITLLQHFRLLLGSPTIAFSATLGALLLGGGIGSLYSQRITLDHVSLALRIAAVGITIWLVIAAFAYPALVDAALPLPMLARIMVTAALTLPLGTLLGMLFPNGLRIAHHRDTGGIPIFWGMNAVASTFGSVMASVIAIAAGFQIALLLGAVMYFGVAILLHTTGKRVLSL